MKTLVYNSSIPSRVVLPLQGQLQPVSVSDKAVKKCSRGTNSRRTKFFLGFPKGPNFLIFPQTLNPSKSNYMRYLSKHLYHQIIERTKIFYISPKYPWIFVISPSALAQSPNKRKGGWVEHLIAKNSTYLRKRGSFPILKIWDCSNEYNIFYCVKNTCITIFSSRSMLLRLSSANATITAWRCCSTVCTVL